MPPSPDFFVNLSSKYIVYLGPVWEQFGLTGCQSPSNALLSRFAFANKVLEGIRGPNSERAAGSTGIHTAPVSGPLYALAVENIPTVLEITALIVEAHVVDFSTPTRLKRGFDGIHFCSTMRAASLRLHLSSSLSPSRYLHRYSHYIWFCSPLDPSGGEPHSTSVQSRARLSTGNLEGTLCL